MRSWGGIAEGVERGINEAIVMRSLRVTWRGVMVGGIDGSEGVGYGGAPDVRYMAGAVGSSSMAGIVVGVKRRRKDMMEDRVGLFGWCESA